MSRDPIKVLIADDTLIARAGWKRILETEEHIRVVGEATTAPEIPKKVLHLHPDVLLIDLKWFEDETAGPAAIAQVKRISPQTKVVAVTVYPHLVADARRAGAEAVLPKGFSRSELVRTILAVHQLEKLPTVDTDWILPRPTGGSPVDPASPARLAAALGLPLLGFVILSLVLMWGIQSLSVEKFAAAMMVAILVYFFGVIFAGRYVDVIGETSMYRLFIQILDIFRIRLPNLLNRNKERRDE